MRDQNIVHGLIAIRSASRRLASTENRQRRIPCRASEVLEIVVGDFMVTVDHPYATRVLGSITKEEISIDFGMVTVTQHKRSITLAKCVFIENVVAGFTADDFVFAVAPYKIVFFDEALGLLVLVLAAADTNRLVVTAFVKCYIAEVIAGAVPRDSAGSSYVSAVGEDQSSLFVQLTIGFS